MRHIVDISKWNANINWEVAAPQLELAICRVQYCSNVVDELYNQHVSNLEARGIAHAAYAYGCYVSINDAIVEVNDFLKRVNKNAKFLVLDVEDDTVASMNSKGNLNDLAKASQVFIDTCKAAGWKVGFYVSHHMYNMYDLRNVKADFLWIPRYGTNDGTPQVKPDFPCELWQYTDNGYLNGIGRVDLNLLNGDKPLSWFTNKQNSLVPEENIDNLGYLKISVTESWVYEKPDENSKVVKKVYKDSRHQYLANAWDGKRFWFKIAENNWITEHDAVIEKDGKTKGVIWNNKDGLECFHYSIADSGVRSRICIGQWEVELRENKDWIYIKDKGWIYFDESYIKWIR